MDSSTYNPLGISQGSIPMNQSPPSNQGVVYQSANAPTNPGSFLPGQTVSLLTFQANVSGRRIRISMNDISEQTGKDPGQPAGSIEIINPDGNFVALMGDNSALAGTGEGIFEAQDLVGNPGMVIGRGFDTQDYYEGSGNYVSTLPLLIVQSNPDNDLSAVAEFVSSIVNEGPDARADFGYIFQLIGSSTVQVYVSNGTSPNGVLNAPVGSICLNASSTGQLAYNTIDGSNVWVEAGAGGGGSTTIAGRMYLNSAQSIANTTQTKVALDTAGITTGVTTDTTNHRITMLTAGTYFISSQVTYDSPPTGKNLINKIFINGVEQSYNIYVTNGTSIQTVQGMLMATLSIGDYIEVWTFHNSGLSEALEVGSEYCFLQAFKV